MIPTDDPFTMSLQRLLVRCHAILWLNCLEPIIPSEVRSQEEVDQLMTDIQETINLEDFDEMK